MKQSIIHKIQQIIDNQNLNEKELLYQLKGVVYQNDLQNEISKESKSIEQLVSENIEKLYQESTDSNTLKTGFHSLDKLLGGFGLGELIVIGGRPGMGKNILLINLALNISVDIPVLYFSFDFSELLLTNRIISSVTGIPIEKIQQQTLTDSEKETIRLSGSHLITRHLYINDNSYNSLTAFKIHCEKYIKEYGVKVIIIDYLQMMSSNKYSNNRVLELGHISKELKKIAKEFNVCIVASSQLSRAVEMRHGDKKPLLADLRDSGAIEQDADKVIALYRPEYYGFQENARGESTKGITELFILKNRSGPMGEIQLMKDINFSYYRDFDIERSEFITIKSRLDEIDLF